MRKFKINVNGNSYEVEVEEIGAGQSVVTSVATPAVATVAAQAAPAPQAKPAAAPAAAPAGATVINAPMPGTILDVKVSVGDSVGKGDVLCILEAMKMENEIMAPSAGKVVAIGTAKGSSVSTGDLLISLA